MKKTILLLAAALLGILSGGCSTDGYGPMSPDYFPGQNPPFYGSVRARHPIPSTVVASRTSLPSQLAGADRALASRD